MASRKKRGKLEQIWVFWAIMFVHALAIFIFTRGFLLTRTELPYYSQCSDVSQCPCFFNSSKSESQYNSQSFTNLNRTHVEDQRCWTKPAIGRLVIIVLDALRFDFVAPSIFFKERKPWMDKLKVLQQLISQNSSSTKIFKAVADPPTTSLQRLKGLTTGGLPTFIDVGNSFGAPAIVEDNLIQQLVLNGKRTVMMGDDTWMQLFPHHFLRSHPYPSFNVKDLDTVDNGCIENLFPSLYQEDWDVLIAHFLGVDHAGHIFSVDSIQMLEKLEQYNGILQELTLLQKVVEVLESQSGPGGLHENTFLLVMGDHGQTINGDHGGGTPEEVDTSIFAMSFKKPPSHIPSEFEISSCQLDLGGNNLCVSSIQQLDFAVTISALLGIPFPYGSIGHVNAELYALGAGTWNFEGYSENCQNQSKLAEWMRNYVNTLCINSWQVKRYIDVYSASSVIGFSNEDLLHVEDLYAQAAEKWLSIKNLPMHSHDCNVILPAIKRQIDLYYNFLASVAELARSKWTEFDLPMMGIGFIILIISLFAHVLFIIRVKKHYSVSFTSSISGISLGLFLAFFTVAVRACSFLSNSYILEEGKVASFLLSTLGVAKLRDSIIKKSSLIEVVVFLLLVIVCRFITEVGTSKQTPASEVLKAYPLWISLGSPVWLFTAEILPIFALIILAFLLYKEITRISSDWICKSIIIWTSLSYFLIAVYWASSSNVLNLSWIVESTGRNSVPRIIYTIGVGQLLLLMFGHHFRENKSMGGKNNLFVKTLVMLSTWSSTIIILLGRQGSLVSIVAIIGGYCIMRFNDTRHSDNGALTVDVLSVTQWNLSAVCLFFCTGHWCAFDGLRYGAAFVGFDEFIMVPQAILLTIDTFGFSIILPVFGIPLLVACNNGQTENRKHAIFTCLSLIYMIYGLIVAITVAVTMLCVIVHRRHLMVWGLFAPKYVFDVVALILTDVLVCVASVYYFGEVEFGVPKDDQAAKKINA